MREIEYRKVGDYLLPNLTVPEEPETPSGKYASLRKNYLKEHRYGVFLNLMMEGKLNEHLARTQEEAQSRLEYLMEEMKQSQKVTEELKAKDQMKWAGMMNNIRQSAEETVLKELVYA